MTWFTILTPSIRMLTGRMVMSNANDFNITSKCQSLLLLFCVSFPYPNRCVLWRYSIKHIWQEIPWVCLSHIFIGSSELKTAEPLHWICFTTTARIAVLKEVVTNIWASIRVPAPAGYLRKSCSYSGWSRFKLKLSTVDTLLRCKQTILNSRR